MTNDSATTVRLLQFIAGLRDTLRIRASTPHQIGHHQIRTEGARANESTSRYLVHRPRAFSALDVYRAATDWVKVVNVVRFLATPTDTYKCQQEAMETDTQTHTIACTDGRYAELSTSLDHFVM